MNGIEKIGLTIEEIFSKYPPREELFVTGDRVISSVVSRNGDGKIIYIKPGTIRELPKVDLAGEQK